MLHINSLLINVHHDEEELLKKISKTVGCNTSDIKGFEIKRRSIDARKKPEIFYSYSIDVDVKNEKRYIKNKIFDFVNFGRYAIIYVWFKIYFSFRRIRNFSIFI